MCRLSGHEYVTARGSVGHFRTTAVKWSLLAEGPPSPSKSHNAREARRSGLRLRSRVPQRRAGLSVPSCVWMGSADPVCTSHGREGDGGILT